MEFLTNDTNKKIPNLKVVTLNIWGIRYISKHVSERIEHIIKALNDSNTDYDIIALQEVWSLNDYTHIRNNTASKYPHAHYFQSGLVGSGCCIFSKHLIEDVFHHVFTLNGYPHKIHHGDWYAGKCVGMVKIKFHDLSVNVYTTHLHANYSRDFKTNQLSDIYLAHRMTQLFELSQFIQNTSHSADLVLLMGDLNTEESEDGFKLLVHNAGLIDAFREKNNKFVSDCHGATCHVEQNCYQLSPAVRKSFPKGLRIDYVMYKNGRDFHVKCSDCKVCFGKIPDLEKDLNYSDHEGVSAEFLIEANSKIVEAIESDDSIETYKNVKKIIEKSYGEIFGQQVKMVSFAFLLLFLLFSFNDSLYKEIVLAKNFIVTILISYMVIYCIIIQRVEKVHLNYTINSIQMVEHSIERRLGKKNNSSK